MNKVLFEVIVIVLASVFDGLTLQRLYDVMKRDREREFFALFGITDICQSLAIKQVVIIKGQGHFEEKVTRELLSLQA